MTLPDERYRAVAQTRQFLLDLLNPAKTPRVPKIIRQRAHSLLRHYPDPYHMDQASKYIPDVFQKEMEPVTRLLKQYEQSKKNEA